MEDLRTVLRVPYIVTLRSVASADGNWLRIAECPELPECRAQDPSAVVAVDKVNEERIRVVLRLLAHGQAPPIPREPLAGTDPAYQLEAIGLDPGTIERLLALDGTDALRPALAAALQSADEPRTGAHEI